MQVLRTIDSQGVVREFPLHLQEGECLTFGRSEDCDISLPEEGNLSRFHCRILRSAGRICIRDNASVNGVYCNGVSVVEAEMRPGAEFVLGLCTLSVAESGDTAAPELPPVLPPQSEETEEIPAIPLSEPLPISAAASAPVPAVSSKPIRIKTLHLHTESATPRRLVTAAAPPPREKKVYRTRRMQTLAELSPQRQSTRRPTVKTESPVAAESLPLSRSGAEWGLPAGFAVSLGLQVPHYPLLAEDTMALTVAADEKCYIAVIQYDAEGAPCLIVPGSDRENTVVFPHVLTRFPRASGADYELVTEAPFGPVQLVLLACSSPCAWEDAYRDALAALGPRPIPGKLEHAVIAACSSGAPPAVWSSAVLSILTQDGGQ